MSANHKTDNESALLHATRLLGRARCRCAHLLIRRGGGLRHPKLPSEDAAHSGGGGGEHSEERQRRSCKPKARGRVCDESMLPFIPLAVLVRRSKTPQRVQAKKNISLPLPPILLLLPLLLPLTYHQNCSRQVFKLSHGSFSLSFHLATSHTTGRDRDERRQERPKNGWHFDSTIKAYEGIT
eukprot:1018061-Rhodomonas_salina.2